MMKRDYFNFGGVDSLAYDVWITDMKTMDAPEREITTHSILGRHGDLVIDGERLKNVEITYGGAIICGFSEKISALMSAIVSQAGYQPLYDSSHPGEFRMAVYRGPAQASALQRTKVGRFELSFFCKPQRYSLEGNESRTFTQETSLYNSTGFTALPLVTVYGSGAGTLTIGGITVEIKALADELTLDCDMQNAYRKAADGGLENRNMDISAPEFPCLKPGYNEIRWSGGVTHIDIVPRWWTI